MRSRMSLFAFLLVAGALALPLAAHAELVSIPFLGHIIPDAYNVCPLGWRGVIEVINRLIAFSLTFGIVFFAPIMLAYGGFLYVVNPVNPGAKSDAKAILWSTVKGIVIALAAWFIVDAIMGALYNGQFGPWNNIIQWGNDTCLSQAGSLPGSGLNQATDPTGVVATANGNALSFGSDSCDSAALMQTLPTLTLPQANTFACLAKPESTCGANLQNGNWNKAVPGSGGKASTAYGAFQVTLSGNHAAYENQACYSAAGVSGPLNCQNGFGPNGFTAGGNPTVLANCMKAAANTACSLNAAVYVLQKQGWSAWTADAKSTTQQACITQYARG